MEKEGSLAIDEIRRRIIAAIFSDDFLMNALVLKGGNALSIVHGVGKRASVDLDFSMEQGFANEGDAGRRILDALIREFRPLHFVVFDYSFEAKPSKSKRDLPEWWGGYLVRFKLVPQEVYDAANGDLEVIRRRAHVLGPEQKRTFSIDISKHEYCASKQEHDLDDLVIFAYSLEMIALEKLRAICQQMPAYPQSNKSPRSRDFYDICSIMDEGVDLCSDENVALLREIFAAKNVPLALLASVSDYRDFHSADWPTVEASVPRGVESFDVYFDRVVALIEKIKRLGIIEPPS